MQLPRANGSGAPTTWQVEPERLYLWMLTPPDVHVKPHKSVLAPFMPVSDAAVPSQTYAFAKFRALSEQVREEEATQAGSSPAMRRLPPASASTRSALRAPPPSRWRCWPESPRAVLRASEARKLQFKEIRPASRCYVTPFWRCIRAARSERSLRAHGAYEIATQQASSRKCVAAENKALWIGCGSRVR